MSRLSADISDSRFIRTICDFYMSFIAYFQIDCVPAVLELPKNGTSGGGGSHK